MLKQNPNQSSNEYNLFLVSELSEDSSGEAFWWYEIYAKSDGCIHLSKSNNHPFPNPDQEEVDYIHICNLDNYIKMLQELRKKCIQKFGQSWSDK